MLLFAKHGAGINHDCYSALVICLPLRRRFDLLTRGNAGPIDPANNQILKKGRKMNENKEEN